MRLVFPNTTDKLPMSSGVPRGEVRGFNPPIESSKFFVLRVCKIYSRSHALKFITDDDDRASDVDQSYQLTAEEEQEYINLLTTSK